MSIDLRNLTDQLVADYLRFQGGSLVIIADQATLTIGNTIAESAQSISEKTENSITVIDLDLWRKGSPLTSLPDELETHLVDLLKGPDKEHNTLLYIMQSLEGESPMRVSLIDLAASRGKIGGLPNCTVDVLQSAFSKENRVAFSEELFTFMQQVTKVELTCDRGSKIHAWLDHDRYDVVNSNGVLKLGTYANPIPAEVFFHPARIEGTLVISGSYGPLMGFAPFVGDYKALMQALNATPIYWQIKESKISEVTCDNSDIKKFVQELAFETDADHGMKIGEFGLPANLYVLGRDITGNLMIDEKGRVHIANGHGYQKRTRCEYDTKVHGDGLIANASLRAVNLDKQFMKENQYNPDIFSSLQ